MQYEIFDHECLSAEIIHNLEQGVYQENGDLLLVLQFCNKIRNDSHPIIRMEL